MSVILDALKKERSKKTEITPFELDTRLKELGCDEQTIDDVIFMYSESQWLGIIEYFEKKTGV